MSDRAKKGLWRLAGETWDGALSVFAPKAAARNRAIRAMEDFSSGATKYDGAVVNGFNAWWRAGGETADDALLPELATLRQRSRDLLRNNPMAIAIVQSLVRNVVGTGLRPQSRIDWQGLGISRDRAKELSRVMESNFRDHAKCMDYEDRLGFAQMQRLSFRQQLESGETLKIRRYVDPGARPWARYGTCWQLVEPDCLATPPDLASDPNVRSGVRLGVRGEPVGYYIARTHPGDSGASWKFSKDDFDYIPAYDDQGRPQVLHRFVKLRPNQTRGVPILAAIVETSLGAKQAFTNELLTMMAGSCLAYFIETDTPYEDAANAADLSVSAQDKDGNEVQKLFQRAIPGMVMELPTGKKVSAFMPNRPSPTFSDYLMFAMRWAGAAAETPYEVYTGDWSNTTYTSGRMSVLNFWQGVDIMQADFADGDCQPTWEMSVEEQMLRGDLPPLRDWRRRKSAWCRTQWLGSARPWVDPLKDVTAKGLALEQNMTTLSQECGEQGDDWEEVLDQRLEERLREIEHESELMERRKDLGLPEPAEKTKAPAVTPKPDEEAPPKKKGANGHSTQSSLRELALRLIEAEESEDRHGGH